LAYVIVIILYMGFSIIIVFYMGFAW
jgi:hypothetical protein